MTTMTKSAYSCIAFAFLLLLAAVAQPESIEPVEDMAACKAAMPENYSDEKKGRLCKSKMARSIVRAGSGECIEDSTIRQHCNLVDSAALSARQTHTPRLPPNNPVIRPGEFALVWGNLTAGDFRTVSDGNDVAIEELVGRAWHRRCTIDSDSTQQNCGWKSQETTYLGSSLGSVDNWKKLAELRNRGITVSAHSNPRSVCVRSGRKPIGNGWSLEVCEQYQTVWDTSDDQYTWE